MEVTEQDLELIYHKNYWTQSQPLLRDKHGEYLYAGDTVEFYKKGDIFPTSGAISNYNGLKVSCFNSILNKWQYYEIKESNPKTDS